MQLFELLADVGHAGLASSTLAQGDVGDVSEDSRLIGKGDLFVARAGTSVDGGAFVVEALNRGAIAAIVSPELVLQDVDAEDPRVLRVEAPGRLLGPLAQARQGNPSRSFDLIAVTGTNGKTSVVSFIGQMLQSIGRKTGTLGTIGYDTGNGVEPARETTPPATKLAELFARARESGCQAVAVEASSHGLHQGRLRGASVNVAVYTNVTRDHLDYHENATAYLEAKATLLDLLVPGGVAVLPLSGGEEIRVLERKTRDRFVRVITYSPLLSGHPLYGAHNAENVGAAAAALSALGVPDRVISGALARLRAAPGRLELVTREDGAPAPRVFVDYAHNPDGLARALDTVRRQARGKVIVVFGCGGERDRGKRPMMGAIAGERSDHVIITNDNPRHEDPMAIIDEIHDGVGEGVPIEVIPDRPEAIRRAISQAGENDLVLVAGKGHETVQVVGEQRIPHDDRTLAREALARWGARVAGDL